MEDLAIVVLVGIVAITEPVTSERGAYVWPQDELGSIGQLVQSPLDLVQFRAEIQLVSTSDVAWQGNVDGIEMRAGGRWMGDGRQ